LRPVFLERQPRAERHLTMLAALSRPALDLVTGNLIRTWLLKKHKPMLADFLDGLGVPHEEGVVENLPDSMDEATLRAAVDGLVEECCEARAASPVLPLFHYSMVPIFHPSILPTQH